MKTQHATRQIRSHLQILPQTHSAQELAGVAANILIGDKKDLKSWLQ